MKVKRNCGITALKAKYFWICVTPWAIGLVLFFILPIVQSLIYSFCSVKLLSGGVALQFQALKTLNTYLPKTRITPITLRRRSSSLHIPSP
jgi:ABC-type sugar transport system permease subunit